MRRIYPILITSGLLLTGCNRSDATNDSADNNFTILQGTVPGTLIEAFCEDGSYYRANSVDNGTPEHPFSLGIPKNLDCRLVMTTLEEDPAAKVITPIRIDTPQLRSSRFHALSDTAELGYIPLATARSDINDSTGDGVSDDLMGVTPLSGTLVAVAVAPGSDPMDSDGDGIINLYEDDDSDGLTNRDDPDDDGDGIDDVDEDEGNDHDHDGIEDPDDVDDDNDGHSDDETEEE